MKFQNCIQCAVGGGIPLTSYFGFPCVKYSCHHIDGRQAEITLYHSKSRLCTALCVMLLLITACVLNGVNIKNAFYKDNALFNVMIHFSDFTLQFGSVMIMMVSILRINTIIGVINTVQDTVDKWEQHTSQILLSKTDTQKLRTRIAMHVVLIGVLVGTLTVILFIVNSNPTWSTAEKVGTLIAFYTNLAFAAFVDIVGHLYMFIFVTYGNQLKTDLIRRLYIYRNLNNLLVSYCQLHIKFKRLAVLFNTFLNPSCLIWLIVCILLLICCSSLILICFLENVSLSVLTRMLVILVILCVSGCIVLNLIVMATTIIEVGRGQLEFLYGYPAIINLTYEEALKISKGQCRSLEFFIQMFKVISITCYVNITLEIIKTLFIKMQSTISVSEMVLVDMRLVGIVTGTVLTYVVVAIQFQLITWNKK